jgi:DNA-binding NarL/FixJ family response regulator
VAEAISVGASYHIFKNCELMEVHSAIKNVLAGQKYIAPLVAYDVLCAILYSASTEGKLTARQKEVLKLVGRREGIEGRANSLGALLCDRLN